MNKTHKIMIFIKFVLLECLMYVCALLSIICYAGGFYIDILNTIIAIILAHVGYKFTTGIIDITFVYINLLLSVYIGSKYQTLLYYNNISSDPLTLVAGDTFMRIAFITTFVFVILFMMIRIVKVIKANKCV